MKRILYFTNALLLTLGLQSQLGFAQQSLPATLAISPTRLELSPKESTKTQAITLLNLSTQDTRVKIHIQNWDLDEHNQYRLLPPDPQSLGQWIIINPVNIVIPAERQQTVRLAKHYHRSRHTTNWSKNDGSAETSVSTNTCWVDRP